MKILLNQEQLILSTVVEKKVTGKMEELENRWLIEPEDDEDFEDYDDDDDEDFEDDDDYEDFDEDDDDDEDDED
jgi:hypothetical protein